MSGFTYGNSVLAESIHKFTAVALKKGFGKHHRVVFQL